MASSSVSIPFVLVVDDEPDQLRHSIAAGLRGRASAKVIHPSELELRHLEKADLVLVDYLLDDWPERDAQVSIALRPATGMALAVLLREHVDRSSKDQLTAFALHTGHLEEIRGRISSASAQHVLARLNNLEWVFQKAEARRYDQMVLLARAMADLPRTWPDADDNSSEEVVRLLGIPRGETWFSRCWREVRECQPPVYELAGGEHGVLFVRWLLHQIMPHPGFLWEAHWVAARLRIPVEEFRDAAGGESAFALDLRSMQYSGVLAGFQGERWWRGALEDYVWGLTNGRGGDLQLLRMALQERAGRDFDWIELDSPVVCVGADLQPTGQFSSPSEAVRLRPDHWPAFADAPWVTLEAVQREPLLAAMVDPLDRDRLDVESD